MRPARPPAQYAATWGGALPGDAVGQVRDSGRIDDPGEAQADGTCFQAVEEADAPAKHDGHQFDGELVEEPGPQALLTIDAPIRRTSLPAAAASACRAALSIPSVTNVYGTIVAGTSSGTWLVTTNSGAPGTSPCPCHPWAMS